MKKNILYLIPLTFLMACEPEFDDVTFDDTAGSADFSSVVAVGNSLTAGFQSSALRRDKQENSFPAMLATQFSRTGSSGAFKQPLLSDGVGVGSSGNAEFGLSVKADCLGAMGPSPGPIAAQGQIDELSNPANFVGAAGPYNNIGVPGAKSFHLVASGYGNPLNVASGSANPYYARFSSPSDPNETLLGAAMRTNPTFFTLWIGNNDILSYATSGGSGVDQTGNDTLSQYGTMDITDPGVFASVYTQLIATLTSGGAKGAVANIPDVTSIPYFTTVPIGTDAVTEADAAALNSAQAYGAYNAGLMLAFNGGAIDSLEMVRRTIRFTGGQINTFVVIDPSLTDLSASGLGSFRHAVPGELMTLTLPGDSLKCARWGTAKAIPPQFHLTNAEITSISNATAAYNATIKSLADANNLAFVDARAELEKLATTGINVGGTVYSDTFGTGGAFSLDGVHPSTRGYAIIANLFIDAINAKYGSTVDKVNVNSFPSVE